VPKTKGIAMKRFLAPLLTVATLVAAPAAFADGFTFTDERCRPNTGGAVCIANAKDVTVVELIGSTVDYSTFVSLNRSVLPNDVDETTVLPARTFYMTSVKS
jgi:hypothetical protein